MKRESKSYWKEDWLYLYDESFFNKFRLLLHPRKHYFRERLKKLVKLIDEAIDTSDLILQGWKPSDWECRCIDNIRNTREKLIEAWEWASTSDSKDCYEKSLSDRDLYELELDEIRRHRGCE